MLNQISEDTTPVCHYISNDSKSLQTSPTCKQTKFNHPTNFDVKEGEPLADGSLRPLQPIQVTVINNFFRFLIE